MTAREIIDQRIEDKKRQGRYKMTAREIIDQRIEDKKRQGRYKTTAREIIDQCIENKTKLSTLVGCIQEIRNIPDIHTLNEEQVKLKVILRILSLLDWDIHHEIVPEYSVGTGRVDYALQINGENKVFIEAKRPKENLENHHEQLLDYSFRKGVELAILTNGIEWWFYLPLKTGEWNNRKFYTINIFEQEIENIFDKFGPLFSRQNVASGKAIQNAESILESSQKQRRVRESLPKAWNSVIKEHPESLIKILIERVVEICDLKLENSEILGFIRSHQENLLLSPELEQKVPPPTTSPIITTGSQNKNQIGKPKRMQIGNESYELEYKYEILVKTANWLIDNGHLKPSECPVKLTSRAKIYFINRRPERAPDLKFWRPQKLKKRSLY